MSFKDYELNPRLMEGLEKLGFEEPTSVQSEFIPLALTEEKDTVALAQTGTGKTAAFGLPLMEQIRWDLPETQAVVLCPTRELCLQITADFNALARFMDAPGITPVYGGTGYRDQIRALKQGARVIIATPGRLVDLIQKGLTRLEALKWLVLDEADIMLNMGFKDELDSILAALPPERTTWLFSATMPREVERIAREYMNKPREITVGEKNKGTANVEHCYYLVHARDKYPVLKRLVDSYPRVYGIIFCRTRAATKDLAEKLIKEGYNADALHGDLSQEQREYIMNKFRQRSLQLLVATDIAARGLDVADLTHVIHFDLPDETEIYNHRSGRTGRAGQSGMSLAIVHMRERGKLRQIQRSLGREIKSAKVPGKDAICEAQLMELINRVHNVNVDEKQIQPYMDVIDDRLAALDRDELIKRFVSLEFNRFLDFYRDLKDIETLTLSDSPRTSRDGGRSSSPRKGRGKGSRRDNSGAGYSWLKVNMGRRDRIEVPHIIGLINQNTRGQSVDIGKIVIGDSNTRFQVESSSAEYVLGALKRKTFRGKRLRLETDNTAPRR